ncbi:SHOCT domain-containing protein [Aequorivita sinensis]|uniref:SHOCT domain-containing protein n=1 Tax=Aequorivita sinensis TaxID=1382458 RepID=UPI001120831A|nr:SHOCT domain-containing protein [Aequorivita sinensis]
MDKDIGVGIIVGLTIATSLIAYNSKSFSQAQKTYLLICIVFPPLQWLSMIIIAIYNSYASQNSPEAVENKKIKQESDNTHKQIENLKDLRDQNILTKEEFDEKVKTINISMQEKELKQTSEYKKLKELFDNGILSQAEFKNKVESLKPGEIKESDIIGYWENENNLLSFEGDSFKYSYKNSTGKGIIGKWSFDKTSNRIVLLRDSKEDYFQILKLSKKEIIYQHKKSKFKFIKQ